MSDPQFKKEDVWAVARALVACGLNEFDDSNRRSYHHYEISCPHCNAQVTVNWSEAGEARKTFAHEVNCPVLIARDLLTGAQ